MIRRIIDKIGRMSPDFISRLFVNIPFNIRHGKKVYNNFEKKIKASEKWNENELESYIVTNFNKIFQHAKRFKLYKEKYRKAGVLDLEINNLEDIKKIPILTRNEIRGNFSEFKGYYLEKTGGTSGKSLPLYLDKHAWVREWAHYHYIWGKVDYKFTDVKFAFRYQKSEDKFIKYDFRHNEFLINIYKEVDNNIDKFFKILVTKNVKYFHGYPSAISDFLKGIEDKITRNQKELLQKQIKCCFFSSEMPLPHIIKYISEVWGLNFIACYGHTEVCVLADTDLNRLDYTPLHTYGYVEVEDNMLLGTSYHNFDMPLIRYNTDDLVRPEWYTNGVLKSFKVEEGRIFDFIYDKKNNKIAATALFRIEYHEIFKFIDYIQVYQEKKGYATILISQDKVENLDAQSLMNFENVNIDFDFIHLKKPVRTASGKVPLRIHKLPNKDLFLV